MNLYESKREKLLNFLKLGLNPFKNFVSTGELKEELGLVKSRNSLFEDIKNRLENGKSLILPLIGDIGVGKTYLYWHFKNNLYFYNTIYASLETLKSRFFYTIYSEFIEILGIDLVRFILNQLCDQWGAFERRFGFFYTANETKASSNALKYFLPAYNDVDLDVLQDVIKGILVHQLDPYKKMDAEEWLLGKPLGTKELRNLNLDSDLHKSRNAYVMLRILVENAKLDTVLFIDDFEKIIASAKSTDEETEEVFDPSWLYGKEKSPDYFKSEKLLNKLISLMNIRKFHLVITLKSPQILDEIKQLLEETYPQLRDKIGEPLIIENFKEKDIYEFYTQKMLNFYEEMDLKEFIDAFHNPYYPLDKKTLKKIFLEAQGNPRGIIKSLINLFNEIIYSEENLDTILDNYYKSNHI